MENVRKLTKEQKLKIKEDILKENESVKKECDTEAVKELLNSNLFNYIKEL